MARLGFTKRYMLFSETDEYQNSTDTPFDYDSFLALQKPTSRAYGFEELPPSCIKSMKSKRCAKFTDATHLQCLVDFYTHRHDQAFHGSLLNFTPQRSSSNSAQSIPVDTRTHKFNAIDLLGNYFKSMESNTRLYHGSYAQAYYDIFEDGEMVNDSSELRLCQIEYFFRHTVILSDDGSNIPMEFTHTLAFVRWFKYSTLHLHKFDN
ncbi:hypothetical protein PS15p_208452 [Mucor circinelloides]